MNEPKDPILDPAITALRNQPIPAGPSATLLAAAVAKVEAQSHACSDKGKSMKRFWSLAASLLILIGLTAFGIWQFAGNGTPLAFADVVNQIKLARSAEFRLTSTVDIPGMGVKNTVMHIIIIEPARLRAEYLEGPAPKGMTTVFDFQQRKGLVLIPAQKSAVEFNLDMEKKNIEEFKNMNLLQEMQKWNPKNAQMIGKRMIKGRPATGFHSIQSEPEPHDVTVWADDQTRLPVEMETRVNQMGGIPQNTSTMTDFQWDSKFDESLITLTPPPDYELQKLNVDMSEPTEKDVLETLRSFSEISDGEFPDHFSKLGLQSVIQKVTLKFRPTQVTTAPSTSAATTPSTLPTHYTAEQKALQAKLRNGVLQIGRGLMVAGNQKYGTDWHYAGKGAKLNDLNRPILWYRPIGQETYHVIDATLTVREIPANEVPTIPSVKIESMIPQTQPAASQPSKP